MLSASPDAMQSVCRSLCAPQCALRRIKFDARRTNHAWSVSDGCCASHNKAYLAGGRIVIATWCQREETPDRPFTPKDKSALQFLYDEWAHPYFVSVQEYGRLLEVSIDCIARHLPPWACFTAVDCH